MTKSMNFELYFYYLINPTLFKWISMNQPINVNNRTDYSPKNIPYKKFSITVF